MDDGVEERRLCRWQWCWIDGGRENQKTIKFDFIHIINIIYPLDRNVLVRVTYPPPANDITTMMDGYFIAELNYVRSGG